MHCLENGQECCLTELFYYNPSEKRYADLQKGLKEYRFFLLNTSLAIQNLQNKNLEKFDALVGENACQIRAIRIALIASKDLETFNDLAQRITNALKKVDALLLPASINRLMSQGPSLSEIIDKNELQVKLSPDQMFVVQSFILSEMRESQSDPEFTKSLFVIEKIVPGKLKSSNPQVSLSFLDRLASRLRKLLSHASVDFVRHTASFLQNRPLIKMVSKNFGIEHNNLSCIPMFWSYKTLLSLAYHEKISLIFHVKFLSKLDNGYRIIDEDFLFFRPCPNDQCYRECIPTEEDFKSSACVIQGAASSNGSQHPSSKLQWKQRMLKRSPIDVILAGAADHRQYPDPEKKIPIQSLEYEDYKQFAEKYGFSLNNPTTFFIQHVYATQVGKKLFSDTNIEGLMNQSFATSPAINF